MRVKKGEIFNSVQVAQLPRNTFDLTHQHATTMNFADLVPICTMEAIPGDIFDISSDTFIRLQPLLTPMMHRCDFTVHYFFVPNRIIWPGWEDFITGNNANAAGLNTPAAPYFTSTHIALLNADVSMSLSNYMGMEVKGAQKLVTSGYGDIPISALPYAAYWKIILDYYVPRELGFDQIITQPLVDGNNNAANPSFLFLHTKGWLRDYFTSALPYAQKGPAVDLPLGIGTVEFDPNAGDGGIFVNTTNPNITTLGTVSNKDFGGADVGVSVNNTVDHYSYDPEGTLIVQTGATTINDLRRAMRLQEWLEKNARAGTRYTESLRAHFNVKSSDARLQRAEYITGIKSPIIVSEVLNTTDDGATPQGNMSGHAIGIGNSYRDKYYCEEHGFIIGLISVTPRPAYTTGMPRFMVKRFDFLDYYWNEFANIGEQEILNVELQTDFFNSVILPTGTFGYIPRYSEYKFKNDMITGEFADNTQLLPGSLRTWVMQRTFGTAFGNQATLNNNFITADIKSVASAPFATEEAPIMVQQVNKIQVSRQMPVYGTPTF